MPILALTADLMFAARIRGTAQTIGAQVTLARTPDDLLAKAKELVPRRILLDLDARNFDPVDVITALKADDATRSIPILAYVSHVNEERIKAARSAGADQVMARGAFVRDLNAILADRGARSADTPETR